MSVSRCWIVSRRSRSNCCVCVVGRINAGCGARPGRLSPVTGAAASRSGSGLRKPVADCPAGKPRSGTDENSKPPELHAPAKDRQTLRQTAHAPKRRSSKENRVENGVVFSPYRRAKKSATIGEEKRRNPPPTWARGLTSWTFRVAGRTCAGPAPQNVKQCACLTMDADTLRGFSRFSGPDRQSSRRCESESRPK